MAASKSQALPHLTEDEIRPAHLTKGQEAAYARDIARLQASIDSFVEVVCPACCTNSPGGFHFEKYRFRFDRCHACGTIFMNPRPSEEILAGYYQASENYKYWAKYIFPASESNRRDKICRPRLESLLSAVKRSKCNRNEFMEIGPGFGTFAALVQESGVFSQVRVLEPTPELAAECRKRRLEVIEDRIENASISNNSVDVLCSFEVIEHIFEPRRFLETAFRILRPGGLIMLTCPNGEGFDILELGTRSVAVDLEHLNLFNPRSLEQLSRLAGFEALEISTPGLLDAEIVRKAVLSEDVEIRDPFMRRVLITEWGTLGAPFQSFLADNGLSSHLCYIGRKSAD